MNLLLLDQFSDPGGAQQGLLELLPSFRAQGWTALVGIPGQGELFSRIRQIGFEAERITCGPFTSGSKSVADAVRFAAGTPVLAAEIRRLAAGIHADVIYVNGPRLLPAVALAGLSQPVVFHAHSYLFPGVVRRLAGIAMRRSDAWLIGSCRFVAEPWVPYVKAERTCIIYNGVAGPRIPCAARSELPRPFTVGCIGRIAPEKGQREFVQAAALIRQSIPDCRFVVYGAALFAEAGAHRYDEEVRASAAAVGVEFRGWVSDIYAALETLDLLLVPSAGHEATTRVILEAHSAGVPVIAFRSGGIPEVIDEGRDGWLADSTAEMADRSIALLNRDAASRLAACESARESWLRRFTLERYHHDITTTLSRIAGEE